MKNNKNMDFVGARRKRMAPSYSTRRTTLCVSIFIVVRSKMGAKILSVHIHKRSYMSTPYVIVWLQCCVHLLFVSLLVRMHDIYIASPNCTQPHFSHTQGCMYLAPYETKHCGKARAMDRPTRAAKLAEIWKQLTWLEGQVKIMC